MREAVASQRRDPAEIQIAGVSPLVQGPDGTAEIGPATARAHTLVAAGGADLRVALPVPGDVNAAEDYPAERVARFRAAGG
jgi:hypothetical protein